MLPKDYIHMMYCEFDDGEVMYYKPHSFSLLDILSVKNLCRVSLPKDAIELKGANVDAPNMYW